MGDASESEVESLVAKEMTTSDAAVKNIERVLKEIQQQRIEWESSTQDITQLDVGAQLAEQQQKKVTFTAAIYHTFPFCRNRNP